MDKTEIIDEENSIIVESDFDVTTFEFFPENKTFTMHSSIKDDCFFNDLKYEYKISKNPIEIYSRLLEKSSEPPIQYEVKDGVVLESEILKDKTVGFLKSTEDRILELKKQTEWQKVEMLGNFKINLYILTKHPELISNEEYRRFLRQSSEKIKIGAQKVEKMVKENQHGLEIQKGKYGKDIWYQDNESDKKEWDEYIELPIEKRRESKIGKKLALVEKIKHALFTESSSEYVGVSEHEFKVSDELSAYIEKLLDGKILKPAKTGEPVDHSIKIDLKTRWAIVIVISIIALSGGVWMAIGAFILGAIIINTLVNK